MAILGAGTTDGDVPVWDDDNSQWISSHEYRGYQGFVRADSGSQLIQYYDTGTNEEAITGWTDCEPTTTQQQPPPTGYSAKTLWDNSSAYLQIPSDGHGIYLWTGNLIYDTKSTGLWCDILIKEGYLTTFDNAELRVRVRSPNISGVKISMNCCWVGSHSNTGDRIWLGGFCAASPNSEWALFYSEKVAPRLSYTYLRVGGGTQW